MQVTTLVAITVLSVNLKVFLEWSWTFKLEDQNSLIYINLYKHLNITGMLSCKMLRMIHNWSLVSDYLLHGKFTWLSAHPEIWMIYTFNKIVMLLS